MNQLSRYHRDEITEAGVDSQSLVLRRVPAGARVLDLGCSTGGLAAALEAKGCDVTALDVVVADLAEASSRVRRVLPINLDTDRLDELLPGESFDVVVAADVLEHLRDPQQVLLQCRDLLGPGGVVVFSIPNVAHASVRLALWGGEFPYEDTGLLDRTHLRMFTRASVTGLFDSAGFVIASMERTTLPLRDGVPHRTSVVPRKVLAAMLAEPDADTLQFIGTAEPNGPRNPLPQRPPRDAESAERQLVREQARLLAERDRQIGALQWELARRDARLLSRVRRRIAPSVRMARAFVRAVRRRR